VPRRKTRLHKEELLRDFLRDVKGGRHLAYQYYKTLRDGGPLTTDEIIGKIKDRAPLIGGGLLTLQVAMQLKGYEWVYQDKTTRTGPKKQSTWILHVTDEFADEFLKDSPHEHRRRLPKPRPAHVNERLRRM